MAGHDSALEAVKAYTRGREVARPIPLPNTASDARRVRHASRSLARTSCARSCPRWRRSGERIAFVPTMGNLHAGHGSLVEPRRASWPIASIVSIFVNPLQFGPNEDFAAYPRTPDEDRRVLESLRVDLLFAPEVADMYPRGQESTARVHVPVISRTSCAARSGPVISWASPPSSRSCSTSCSRTSRCSARRTISSCMIIRRAALDLCMPIEIVGVPTTREPDGLAMSSRNRYLSPEERAAAPAIYARARAARVRDRSPACDDFAAIDAQRQRSAATGGFPPGLLRDSRRGHAGGAERRSRASWWC